MAQLLYWLDHGGFAVTLQHSWVWATVVTIVAAGNIIGIAAILRHYDGHRRR